MYLSLLAIAVQIDKSRRTRITTTTTTKSILRPLSCSQKSKNSEIYRALEKKDSTFRAIVNSKLFSIRCLGPIKHWN